MVATGKDPALVVLQLSGANDYLNTVIPFTEPRYRDYRPNLGIPEGDIIKFTDNLGFHPSMGPVKDLWDRGNLAIIHGIGYENSSRSHFRSMDIWHTCEPEQVGTEGWLGRVIRDLDPAGENVLKGVNFGQGLPRAMALRGVPVTSVSDLASYGVLTDVPAISGAAERERMLELFSRVYSPAIGSGPVMDYLGQTGRDALKGADIIKTAPEKYSSSVEYADNPIAKSLRSVAQVHLANLGTQVFYTQYGSFDTHFNQLPTHAKLWTDVAGAVSDFFADLREHDAADNVTMLVFTEFGRRVQDNGTGCDHGRGGVAFAIGDRVKGGMYGQYPSLKAEDLIEGDLAPDYDFRGFYATFAERWLGLDAKPIVGGQFEQLDFL